MKVGAQFLIAVRLLSTVKNLSAHLTVLGRGAQLHVYCWGKSVVYLESTEFPFGWLQQHGEPAIASELRSAPGNEQKLQIFRKLREKPELRQAFREAASAELSAFFKGEILECKLKQFPPVTSEGVLTLTEVFFDCARPFVQNLSPEEMLPTKEIPFKQSPNYVQLSSSVKMGPQDGYLLSRLEQQLTVREILSSIPGDETEMKRSLLVFWAFGALDSQVLNQLVPKIDPGKDLPPESSTSMTGNASANAPSNAAPTQGKPRPSAESFGAESPEQLVQMVNQFYTSLPKKDFYSLLGVGSSLDMVEVKAKYYKLARSFHPDRFYGIQDPILKEKVDVIFSAINVAYETLKSAKRRMEYDNAPKERRIIGTTTLNSENTNTKLTKETMNKVAEEHYKRAQRAYEDGNYYQAVQFLRSATQIEPNVAKYWQQLGISLSRNPQWRKEAEDSFQRAMDLEPKNPENHLYLGFLYKNAGMKLRAKKHFQTCREMDPYNEIALRELRAIDGEPDPDSSKKGLLGNIFKKK